MPEGETEPYKNPNNFEYDTVRKDHFSKKWTDKLKWFLFGPGTWVRENIVEPNQKKYPWYHQNFARVRTIDDCYTDEWECIYEARQQFERDQRVETEILNILRTRMQRCIREEYPDHIPRCMLLKEEYEDAAANWFCKYGDMGVVGTVETALMKQKHRLIWERRHGPVGSGMKNVNPYKPDHDDH